MNALSEKDTARVFGVLQKCIYIHQDLLSPEALADKPLTGNVIQCSAVDLVYILFELEKEFGIKVPPERLDQYQFSSFEKICATVDDLLARV